MKYSRRKLASRLALLILGSPGFLHAGGKPGKMVVAAATVATAVAQGLAEPPPPGVPAAATPGPQPLLSFPYALPGGLEPGTLGDKGPAEPHVPAEDASAGFHRFLAAKGMEYQEWVEAKFGDPGADPDPAPSSLDYPGMVDWMVDEAIHRADMLTLVMLEHFDEAFPDGAEGAPVERLQAYVQRFASDDHLEELDRLLAHTREDEDAIRKVAEAAREIVHLDSLAKPSFRSKAEKELRRQEAREVKPLQGRAQRLQAARNRLLVLRGELEAALPQGGPPKEGKVPDSRTYTFPDEDARAPWAGGFRRQ